MAKFSKKDLNLNGLKQAVEDLRIKAGHRVVELAVQTAPVDTGDYRNNINFDGANTVTAHKEYSAFLEYGTSEHGAKNAKVLRWINKNGKYVFAKKVKGIKPFATMRNAAAQTQKEIPQIWADCQRANNV